MARKRRLREGVYIQMYQAAPGMAAPARKQRVDGFLPEKQEAFFERLSETFNILEATRHAGVSTSTIHLWRKHNAEFAERFSEALARGYLDVKARMIAIALQGARRTSSIVRSGDSIVTSVVDDAPGHVMRVMRFHLEEIAAFERAKAGDAEVLDEPSEEQLVQWLRDGLDAVEAMPVIDDRDGDER